MAERVSAQQNALRTVRIIHGFMLVMVVAYAFLAERLGPSNLESSPDRLFLIAIAVVAVLDVLIAMYFRVTFVSVSADLLRTQPDDAEALKRWRSGSVVVSVLCLTVAMYGFVLRFLGFGFAQCLPFYALAFVLLLLWWPRLDL